MKSICAFLLTALLVTPLAAKEIKADWLYHAIGSSSRTTEKVPGEDFTFLANGTDQISDADTVTLYLLSGQDFAGSLDEQVFVRWWDGTMSHWIMGSWVKNITLHSSRPESTFHGQPTEGTLTLDLWKIEIPPLVTQPGENFYAIQIKGYSQDSSDERYLLSRPGGDFSRTNRFGQIWSSSEEFDGQDWRVNILQ